MNIKDYIHYYIGQKFIAEYKLYTMHRVDYHHSEVVRGIRISDAGFERWNEFAPNEIKLILRRLEDMTEEEAIAVHREATKTPFLPADKDEYDVTYIKDKGDLCSIQVVDLRIPKIYTNINIEGDVLTYVHEQNEEPKIVERVSNQHHITHYLLKQGFDLWGLIDAGLAVDAKRVNQ